MVAKKECNRAVLKGKKKIVINFNVMDMFHTRM